MSRSVLVGLALFILVLSGFILISKSQKNSDSFPIEKKTTQQQIAESGDAQAVDRRASFAIFTNSTFRVFTAAMYHNLSEDVFIQSDKPNIIHIKKPGITWNDFFKTLPLTLTKDCLITGTKETFCTGTSGSLVFYLNSKHEQNALDKEINSGDQLLVSFGKEDDKQIQKQLQQVPEIN